MKMKPLGDLLLIKLTEEEKKTSSGILLTSNQSSFIYGEVISTGNGLFTQTGDKIPMTVHVGDTVILQSSMVSEPRKIILEGAEYVLVRESELSMFSRENAK